MSGEASAQDVVDGPALSFIDRRVVVNFPPLTVSPGVVISEFTLQVPEISYPFDVSGGAAKHQRKRLQFGSLELAVNAAAVEREAHRLRQRLPEFSRMRAYLRNGHLEIEAAMALPAPVPVTFKVAIEPEGEKLVAHIYDFRMYAFAPVPSCRLAALAAEALAQSLPRAQTKDATVVECDLLTVLVEQASVARGYKVPALDSARLAVVGISQNGVQLRFGTGTPTAVGAPDLLLTIEGARTFAGAEALVARNELAAARAAYLVHASDGDTFALERLVSFLVADVNAHELALELCALLQQRAPHSATALWSEAIVREERGEFAKSAERFLALCALARKGSDTASAACAAEAAARAAAGRAPNLEVRALHELLGVRPDHVPALAALAKAALAIGDRAGAARAYRRLAALSRDSEEAASAHIELGRLSAQLDDNTAAARLQAEAALRLSPDNPRALQLLGELCFRSGENLRALQLLDRLRDVALNLHDVPTAAAADLLAGQVWEEGLHHAENARIRYRAAATLAPDSCAPRYRGAKLAEANQDFALAMSLYSEVIDLAGPAPVSEEARTMAIGAHRALAALSASRLGQPERAHDHLRAILALDGSDAESLGQLLPILRAHGDPEEYARACESAAAIAADSATRARYLVDGAEALRGRPDLDQDAIRMCERAFDAVPTYRPAHLARLAIAERRRDVPQICTTLQHLADTAENVEERAGHLRRLGAVARDLKFDFELAGAAYRELTRIAPDDAVALGELVAIERRRHDSSGLVWALEQRARVLEARHDLRGAASALRELGSLLDARLARTADAVAALERAVRLHPDSDALLELSGLVSRGGAADPATLEAALALLPSDTRPEKRAHIHALAGRAWEAAGDADRARGNYVRAFETIPLDDEVFARLQAAYDRAHLAADLVELWQARSRALAKAGRAIEAAPLYLRIGQSWERSGDYARALAAYEETIATAGATEDTAQALRGIARLELARGRTEAAIDALSRRARLASGAAAATMYEEAARLVQGTHREVELLGLALASDESHLPALLRRAELTASTNLDAALADLERALQTPRALDVEVGVLERGWRMAKVAGSSEATLDFLTRYCTKAPHDLPSALELATLLQQRGNWAEVACVLARVWRLLEGAEREAALLRFVDAANAAGRESDALAALRDEVARPGHRLGATLRLYAVVPRDAVSERMALVGELLASATGEERVHWLEERAMLWRQRREFNAARGDLLAAAALSSDPARQHVRAAEVAREADDVDAESNSLLASAAALGTEPPPAIRLRVLELAHVQATGGAAAAALTLYDAATQWRSDVAGAAGAHLGAARAARRLGLRARAEALLHAAAKLPVGRDIRIEAWRDLGDLKHAEKDFERASEAWQQVLELAPDDERANSGMREVFAARDDWRGLAAFLEQNARRAAGAEVTAVLHELSSVYLDHLGETAEAERVFKRIVALDPHASGVREKLATLLAQRDAWEEAIDQLKRAAQAAAPAEASHRLRTAADLARDHAAAAVELELLRQAHALAPAVGADARRLAESLYRVGDYATLLPLQAQLLGDADFARHPADAEATYLRYAKVALALEHEAAARAALETLVRAQPRSGAATEALAALLDRTDQRAALILRAQHLGRGEVAEASAAKLVSLAAVAHSELADVDLAVTILQMALPHTANEASVLGSIARYQRADGRRAALVRTLMRLGQFALDRGEVSAAREAWLECAGIARDLALMEDEEAALTNLCTKLVAGEWSAAQWYRRAQLRAARHLDDEVFEFAERAWALEPTAAIAEEMARLAEKRGDGATLIHWLSRCAAQRDGATGLDAFLRVSSEAARLAESDETHAARFWVSAVEAGRTALGIAPGDARAQRAVTHAMRASGDCAGLAYQLEAAAGRATEKPDKARLWIGAAQVSAMDLSDSARAIAGYLKAAELLDDDSPALSEVADALEPLDADAAARIDARVLARTPDAPQFARLAAYLARAERHRELAELHEARAGRESQPAASYLAAADAYRAANDATGEARANAAAFDAAPENHAAFERALASQRGEPRRAADVLAARARAVPSEAPARFRERASLLMAAHDDQSPLALDDYLAVAPDDVDALRERGDLAAQLGGARAAQPYDRRLLAEGGTALASAERTRLWLRLGTAALETNAYRDAAEAFEAVSANNPSGEARVTALAGADEAYRKAGDAPGQFHTGMLRAEMLSGDEASAIYRGLLELNVSPLTRLQALRRLAAMHPGDRAIFERTRDTYASLGMPTELVALYESYASAAENDEASEALLAAADLINDERRAAALRHRALELVASSDSGLREVEDTARRISAVVLLEDALRRRISIAAEPVPLKIELAKSLEGRGACAEAVAVWTEIAAANPPASLRAQVKAAYARLNYTPPLPTAVEARAAASAGFAEGDVARAIEAIDSIMAVATLSPEEAQQFALNLAPFPTGAALSVKLLKLVVAQDAPNAAAWELLAAALRALGNARQASFAQNLADALNDIVSPPMLASISKLPAIALSYAAPPPPSTRVPANVAVERLPALQQIAAALGAPELNVIATHTGPPRLYLSTEGLVVSAAALAAFGPTEMPAAVALALRLGSAGGRLGVDDAPTGLAAAVGEVFDAYAVPRAICAVLAYALAAAQKTAVTAGNLGALVAASPGLPALAQRILALLA